MVPIDIYQKNALLFNERASFSLYIQDEVIF